MIWRSMDRINGNSNYLGHSYKDGVPGSTLQPNSYLAHSNGSTMRPAANINLFDKNEIKNKNILLQHNLMNQNYNSIDFENK